MEWRFCSNTWQRKCHFRYWLLYFIKREYENSVGRPEMRIFSAAQWNGRIAYEARLATFIMLAECKLPACTPPPHPPPPVLVTSSAQLLPAVSTKILTRWHARNYYYKTKLTHLRIRLLPVSVSNPILTLSLSFVISLCLLNYACPSFIQPCQRQLISELFLCLIFAVQFNSTANGNNQTTTI